MKKQLSFNDLAGVDITARSKELQQRIDQNKAEIKIQSEIMRGGADEPPTNYDADFWEDSVTRAVLRVNRAQRELEAEGGSDEALQSLIHAQDWLCLELPEWCHDILREW